MLVARSRGPRCAGYAQTHAGGDLCWRVVLVTEFDRRKHCGGKRRGRPGRCTRPKGWGTDHSGHGRCKFHGGTSPNGRKAAGKERALTFAVGALGAEISGNPLDAMSEAVGLARGVVAYYRHELADASLRLARGDEGARARIEELSVPYLDALKLEKDVSKAAIDTGIAERRQRLAEREADVLAAAISDALAEVFGELATNARQAAFAKVVRARLLVFEGGDSIPARGRELPAAA